MHTHERYTGHVLMVMHLANQEAHRFTHEFIDTEHVLLGLIKLGQGVAADVLKNLAVDLNKIEAEVEELVQGGPEVVTMGKLPMTPRAKKVIEHAQEEACKLNQHHVGTEHILLGLLREQEGVAAQVLIDLGVTMEGAREGILAIRRQGLDSD